MGSVDGGGGLNRREFLRRATAAGIAVPALSAILAACQDSGATGGTSGAGATANPYGVGGIAGAAYPLARTDAPVTWHITDANPPIPSGLEPERGATLKVFNWGYYLKPKVMRDFGRAYGCEVELTDYADVPTAFQKLRSGQVDFDVMFGLSPDYMGKMIAAGLLRPLNHDYLPNFAANVWDQFRNPWYDQEARYTVPYTVLTTGVFWRNDLFPFDVAALGNPYDVFWTDAPPNKTHLLRNRDPLAMAMMRRGLKDVNTTDPAVIQQAHDDVLEIVRAVDVKWDNDDYSDVPQGQAWLHHSWSGNALDAFVFYLTPEIDAASLQYVWPPALDPSLPGAVASDIIGVLTTGKNPVLAHLFADHMFRNEIALENFATYTGYQPPVRSINPDAIVADGIAPPNLATTVVREEDFAKGLQLAELPPEAEALWSDAYQRLQAGV
jgi:spermidine/putrescine transport system substrate-binding protein